MRPSFADVRDAARGRWSDILPALGIEPHRLDGRHHDCQGCGGRDRFRFDDRDGSGTFFCGGGGSLRSGDGFRLLQHVFGMSAAESLAAVGEFLGIEGSTSPQARQRVRAAQEVKRRAEIEVALLHELYVLQIVLAARVSGRVLAVDRRFRAARPDWQPMPVEHWEREKLAAARIQSGVGALYGG